MSYAIQNFLIYEYKFFLNPRILYLLFLKYYTFFFFLRYMLFCFLLYKNFYYISQLYQSVFIFYFYRYLSKYYYLDLLRQKKYIYFSKLFMTAWFWLLFRDYSLTNKLIAFSSSPLMLHSIFIQYNKNMSFSVKPNLIYLFLFWSTGNWIFFIQNYNFVLNFLFPSYSFFLCKFFNTQFFQIYYI